MFFFAIMQVQIHQPTTFTFFKKKFDMDEPPALEDGSSFGRIRHRGKGNLLKHWKKEVFWDVGI